MKFLNLLTLVPLIQAIPIEPLAAQNSTHDIATTPRLAVYVQTYHDEHNKDMNLSILPLLDANIQPTHVILAALHVMATPGLIHLNDDPPNAQMYDELWSQVQALQTAGIKVSCMMGGAAPGTWDSFVGSDTEFHQYYDPLLNNFIKKYNLDGIDIDVEQFVDLTVALRFIKQLYNDMGPDFVITMAPVASALSFGGSLSGFSYADLDAQARDSITGAPMITFFNAQFTNGWGYAGNTNDYDAIINAGWDPSRVVMLVSAATNDASGWVPISTLQKTIRSLRNKYPNFGGVNGIAITITIDKMFSKLSTKLALRKAGLPTNTLSTFSIKNLDNGDQKSMNSKSGKNGEPPVTWAESFSNMTSEVNVPKSWKSWGNPAPAIIEVAAAPVVGTKAPNHETGSRLIDTFLPYPVAEKIFIELRRLANKHQNLHFIAISHGSKVATDKWVQQIGGAWSVEVVVDDDREIYANWGLGVSTTWHLLNPWTEIARQKLGKQEGIWGREVDPSGNRWVVGGSWATDEMGTIRWGGASKSADEMADLVEACKSVGVL
ncbi:hypothetical protein SBOR_5434 [Sclerotinia borealis F-4128]|uniref:GH18 domain-containing protein n=1 Tax=Sclerotinia borealis (strain F-4128) TaxID=1432307 RepID=W9CE58_SCLBF|nr:hypothetical protein SBOR_5434 [Sclerotinia borealis F-4128]